MKWRIFLLIVIVTPLIGAGCSRDDDSGENSLLERLFGGAKQGIQSSGRKAGEIIGNTGDNFVRGLKDEQRQIIDEWLLSNLLNQYGDPPDTMYTGGTPLFDEMTGESKDRFLYLFEKFPNLKDIVESKQ